MLLLTVIIVLVWSRDTGLNMTCKSSLVPLPSNFRIGDCAYCCVLSVLGVTAAAVVVEMILFLWSQLH